MTTTTRGRIPRLICASCISSALLISAGATTAIAATQSPTDVPVQQIPRDDSGGSNQGSDSGGSSTSTDNGGNDTGSSSGDQSGNGSDTANQPSDTGDHPNTPSDNGGSSSGDQSGNGSDTANQPSDTGDHPSTPSGSTGTDTDGTHNGGSDNNGNTTTRNGGGQPPSDTVKQPGNGAGGVTDQQACAKSGGIWADGYCGKAGKISVPNNKPDVVPTIEVPPAAVQTGKCFLEVYPATGAVGPIWKVASWINTTTAVVSNSQTGKTVEVALSAAQKVPALGEEIGPGKIVACGLAVKMVAEEVQKNPQGAQQILADIKKQTEKLLKSTSETPAAVHNFACAQAERLNAPPSVLAQLKCA